MLIFPAIDIRNGKAVRLEQGDFEKAKVYFENPLVAASEFCFKGARNLHVVDLDGALSGETDNFDLIKEIVRETGLSVQVGGGIRSLERIEKYLDAGVARVILGSAAVENFELLQSAIESFGDKIAVGLDAKDGFVAIRGWKEITPVSASDFMLRLKEAGVGCVVYTDIGKDGMLEGADTAFYARLNDIGMKIVASGGISSLEEIRILKGNGVYGAILGKALYEGRIKLEDALAI
jgi:phosphoribosylformimino-5-aminoimidazole carboxamide ribotide isomerase